MEINKKPCIQRCQPWHHTTKVFAASNQYEHMHDESVMSSTSWACLHKWLCWWLQESNDKSWTTGYVTWLLHDLKKWGKSCKILNVWGITTNRKFHEWNIPHFHSNTAGKVYLAFRVHMHQPLSWQVSCPQVCTPIPQVPALITWKWVE